MVWLGLAGPGFLETMLWQGLFWQLSGGPCAPGGAFVGPINEERRMAMLELCPAWPWLLGAMVSLWSAWVWLGRASLKPCSGKVCFGSFRVALVHLEALSSDQLMKREGWLCWSSVRPGPGFLELWSRYGLAGPGFLETMLWQGLFWQLSGGPCEPGGAFVGPINEERRMAMLELCPACGLCFWLGVASRSYGLAMVWLGRASLKPCSGKVCFGSFRVALVHLEALSSDQLMKREGWLCWSSVRLAVASWSYGLAMVWQGLFWQLSGGPCAPGGAFVGPINEERRMAMLELCPAWPGLRGAMVSLWSRYGLAGPGFLETMLWQGLFWQLSGGPCAPGGAFVGPINEERRMAMLELCPAWPWLLGAMVSLWSGWVWLGRASLKPCSGKVCFGSFRVALVHLEALSSDQLMKREGWLCWSSVRPGPGFLELWSRYGLAGFGWAGLP